MRKLPITQVDAFADAAFTGNPAAVMPLDAWLDDAVLQAIAQENNLAETAFLIPDDSGEADHVLRWFTPAVEVALCGHATLASGHVLLSADPALDRVRFRTTRGAGVLTVTRDGAGGYALDLPAIRAVPADLPDIAAAMGGAPVATLWSEGGYALIVYAGEAEVLSLTPDLRALATHGDVAFIATAPGEATDFTSRVFVPGAGIDEDPVTGSAHCVLAPYWAERTGRATLTAWQASARGGRLGCRVDGERVILSGRCVTVIEGLFLLPG